MPCVKVHGSRFFIKCRYRILFCCKRTNKQTTKKLIRKKTNYIYCIVHTKLQSWIRAMCTVRVIKVLLQVTFSRLKPETDWGLSFFDGGGLIVIKFFNLLPPLLISVTQRCFIDI